MSKKLVNGSKKSSKSKNKIRNRMAVMENSKRQDGKKDRSKIVKTLEPLQGIADYHMLPLESLAGKSLEEKGELILEWKQFNREADVLRQLQLQDANLKRCKQLLDWWIKGYSIQPENQLQVEFIKYCIATHYIPNGDGTFTFSSSLAELHPWEQKTSVEEVAEESSENSSPKTARKLRRERTPTSNERLNHFIMSALLAKANEQRQEIPHRGNVRRKSDESQDFVQCEKSDEQ